MIGDRRKSQRSEMHTFTNAYMCLCVGFLLWLMPHQSNSKAIIIEEKQWNYLARSW